MIIELNTPGRDDSKEIRTNADYLMIKHGGPRVTFEEFIVGKDTDHILHFVAHGDPQLIANLMPEQLASYIATYINKNQIKGAKIFLHSCNSGNEENINASYAEELCLHLFEKIMVKLLDQPIEIQAPTGMVVIFPDGDEEVIYDKDPYVIDKDLDRMLKKIDIHRKMEAQKELDKYRASIAYTRYSTVPWTTFFKSSNEIQIIEDEQRHVFETLQNQDNLPYFLMSQKTHDVLTKKFAKETQDDYSHSENYDPNYIP